MSKLSYLAFEIEQLKGLSENGEELAKELGRLVRYEPEEHNKIMEVLGALMDTLKMSLFYLTDIGFDTKQFETVSKAYDDAENLRTTLRRKWLMEEMEA